MIRKNRPPSRGKGGTGGLKVCLKLFLDPTDLHVTFPRGSNLEILAIAAHGFSILTSTTPSNLRSPPPLTSH